MVLLFSSLPCLSSNDDSTPSFPLFQLRLVFVYFGCSYGFSPSHGYELMYGIVYQLFPCFPAGRVSYRRRDNFLLIVFFRQGLSEQPDCTDYFDTL
jgi:hypothetical protein